MSPLILIVDDEPDWSPRRLPPAGEGYAPAPPPTADTRWPGAAFGRPDLIVLDLMLPDMPGTGEFSAPARGRSDPPLPILMLTPRRRIDRVSARGRRRRLLTKPSACASCCCASVPSCAGPHSRESRPRCSSAAWSRPRRYGCGRRRGGGATALGFACRHLPVAPRPSAAPRDLASGDVGDDPGVGYDAASTTHVKRLRGSSAGGAYIETLRGVGTLPDARRRERQRRHVEDRTRPAPYRVSAQRPRLSISTSGDQTLGCRQLSCRAGLTWRLVPGGLYMQRELRVNTGTRIERDLERDLQSARLLLYTAPARYPGDFDAWPTPWARRSPRVLFDHRGRVVCDSEVALAGLARARTHAPAQVMPALATDRRRRAGTRAHPTICSTWPSASRPEPPRAGASPHRCEIQSAFARCAGSSSSPPHLVRRHRAVGRRRPLITRTLLELVDSDHRWREGAGAVPLAGRSSVGQEIARTVLCAGQRAARSQRCWRG